MRVALKKLARLLPASLILLWGQAQAGSWSPPGHGYVIEVGTPDGVPQHAGAPALIGGTIRFVGDSHGKPDSTGKCHGGKAPGTRKGKGKGKNKDKDRWSCPPLPSLLDQLKEDGVSLQAFFPDQTSDVSSSLILSGTPESIAFRFTSPALQKEDLNQFTIQVSHRVPEMAGLQKIQTKIDLRVTALDALLSKLAAGGASPEKLASLRALREQLQAISDRITAKLQSRTELMAQAVHPLQVGNQVAQAGLNSSVQGHFRVLTRASLGSAIEGDKTRFSTQITHLGGFDSEDDELDWSFDDDHDRFVSRFYWKGAQVGQLGPRAIREGESLEYEYATQKLDPEASNRFEAKLWAWEGGKPGKAFADLAYDLPVAEDSIAPRWLAGSSPAPVIGYVQQMEPVSALIQDDFGRLDQDAFRAVLSGSLVSGASYNQEVASKLTVVTPGQGQSYSITGNLNPLEEGLYTLKLYAQDLASNLSVPSPLTLAFRVDRTAPTITLGLADPILTNHASLTLPVSVMDWSPTQTTVVQNGMSLLTSPELSFEAPLTLQEGPNLIEVTSIDAAGNQSPPSRLLDVVLDTISPELSSIKPTDGELVQALSFPVSGKADERLSSAKVNGQSLSLSPDLKAFSGSYSVPAEGEYTLHFETTDLAGNIKAADIHVRVSLRVLNGDLITVLPDPDGYHLQIRGAPYATRPGASVSASASLFNSGSAVGADDGSFLIRLSPFTQATVKATQASQTESATVSYGPSSDTVLSGVVKDAGDPALGLDPRPLAGVKVSVAGSPLTAVTDGTGTFSIRQPHASGSLALTGSQTLVIDGSTALQLPPPAPQRKFFTTHISISIGLSRSNVFPYPIYLTGVPVETPVSDNTSARVDVAASNDPDVVLSVPGGSATFPDGSKKGQIYLSRINKDYSTTAHPPYARPKHTVIALEPSGLKFSQPADLQLPNDNHLPPGVELIIMSMNSAKGRWEIDGVAKVTDDGRYVRTKPGMGITHFSQVFAAPRGPTVSPLGDAATPGADMFNGAMSTSIKLPSFKTLGQDLAPSLTYKSSWASPTALVTNLFSIPRSEMHLDLGSAGGGIGRIFRVEIEQSADIWYQPKYFEAQFFTNNFTGDPVRFGTDDPSAHNQFPNNVVLSYALPLKDKASGETIPSDIYPYNSHYEVHLEEVVVTTTTKRYWHWFGDPQVSVDVDTAYNDLEKAFPSDVYGNLYVQNQTRSPAGSGWRVSGYQRIINPTANKLMMEESDGAVSLYAINNTISTAFDAASHGLDLSRAADISRFPDVYAMNWGGDSFYKIDLSSASPSVSGPIGSVPGWVGALAGNNNFLFFKNFPWPSTNLYYCAFNWYSYSVGSQPRNLTPLPDGTLLVTDSIRHAILQAGPSGSSYLTGVTSPAPTFMLSGLPFDAEKQAVESYCSSTPGVSCSHQFGLGGSYISPVAGDPYATCAAYSDHGPEKYSVGPGLHPGYNGDNAFASTNLNQPMAITAGPRPNTVVFADAGNNLVRLLDLNSGRVQTIAGNTQPVDNGDGKLATQAGIFQPQGVAYDTLGNLYISSRNGLVRKVDTLGKISTLVGTILDEQGHLSGGRFVDASTPASQVLANNPMGLVVDNQNGYLYIADRDSNKVRRLDLQTLQIETVAGGEVPIPVDPSSRQPVADIGDGGAALFGNLYAPTWLGLDSDNSLLIVDSGHHRIRRVTFLNTSNGYLTFAPASRDHSLMTMDSSVSNPDLRWKRTYRNGSSVYFNASTGMQTLAVDRVGRQTAYSYDSRGRLAQVQYPTGQSLQYGYTGDALSSVTDPAGKTTTFQVVGGQLKSVTFPDGKSRSYAYDSQGLLTSEWNERNKATTYTYNEWNRIKTITRPGSTKPVVINDSASATASNSYTAGAAGTPKTFGPGSEQLYDGIQDVKSNETKFIKGTNGYVTTIIDSENNKIVVDRDGRGKPTLITRYDSTGGQTSQVSYTYDSNNSNPNRVDDLLWTTDTATGITTGQTYDDYGNPLIRYSGRIVGNTRLYSQTHYNSIGLVDWESDPMGHRMLYGYDATGLRLGLPTQKTMETLGTSVQYQYDANGNLIEIRDTSVSPNRVTSYQLDLAGNVISKINPKGQITCYSYDAWNRITQVVTHVGSNCSSPGSDAKVTTYTYWETGELKSVRDALGNEHSYVINDSGQVVSRTDAAGSTWTYEYDESGNLVKETDPNQNIKTFRYDSQDRVIAKLLPENTYNYQYDSRGNLLQIKNDQSQIDIEYDLGNRQTAIHAQATGVPSATLSFGYDEANNRTWMVDPTSSASNPTRYSYNNDNQLTDVVNPRGEAFHFDIDSGHRLRNIHRNTGSSSILSAFDYSPDNSLKTITHRVGSSVLSSLAYQRDLLGQVTQIDSAIGQRTFEYDDENQLIGSSNTEAPSASAYAQETFAYDAIYNRKQESGRNYVYEDTASHKGQRLLQDGRYFYFYDRNGNLTSKQAIGLTGEVTNYSYSSENQLLAIRIYQPSGAIDPSQLWTPQASQLVKEIQYGYDALGRRIRKNVIDSQAPNDPLRSFARGYVYDGQDLLLEYDGSGSLLARYTHRLSSGSQPVDDVLSVAVTVDGVSARVATTAGSYLYLKDSQGTIQDVMDAAGSRVLHYVYSAFGVLIGIQDATAADVNANPPLNTAYGYTGRELDRESGLMYYRARYYDPGTGRFLQKDPEPGQLNDPRTVINSYVYVANNPASLVDPTGRFFVLAVIIGAAILGGAVGAKLNYDAAKSAGLSGWDLFGSTLLGFSTGAAVAGLSIAMPALAPIWGAAGAFVNNVGNQWIERGDFSKIDWGRAALSGLVGGAVSWGIGAAFGAIPGVDRVFTAEGQALVSGPFGAAAGYCVDSGFGSDQNFEIFCGVKIKPENQVPQQSK